MVRADGTPGDGPAQAVPATTPTDSTSLHSRPPHGSEAVVPGEVRLDGGAREPDRPQLVVCEQLELVGPVG